MLQNRVKQFSKLGSCMEWRSRLWGTADLFRARSGDMSGVGGSWNKPIQPSMVGSSSTSAATAVGSWAEPVSLLSNCDKLLHFQEGHDPELHTNLTCHRALASTPARHSSAGEALSQCIQMIEAFTNSTPKHIPPSSHQGLATMTQVTVLRWGGSGHRTVKIQGNKHLRNAFWSRHCQRSEQGTDIQVLSPLGKVKRLLELAAHWTLMLEFEDYTQKKPGGKQELSVNVKGKAFSFVKGSGRSQHSWGKWDPCRNWGLWPLTVFHRKESLGCGSGFSANLDLAVFCPGTFETCYLVQNVQVLDQVADDP